MKRRELEKKLTNLGWRLLRHGSEHDVWCSADGKAQQSVPRHSEINEYTARAIVRMAKNYEERKP